LLTVQSDVSDVLGDTSGQLCQCVLHCMSRSLVQTCCQSWGLSDHVESELDAILLIGFRMVSVFCIFLIIEPTRCTNFSYLFWKETLHVLDSLQAVSKPVWYIPLLCVQWKTPDDGQRNCPKHVEFLSKINLRN
jgi:hypothetical protein